MIWYYTQSLNILQYQSFSIVRVKEKRKGWEVFYKKYSQLFLVDRLGLVSTLGEMDTSRGSWLLRSNIEYQKTQKASEEAFLAKLQLRTICKSNLSKLW